MATPKKKVSRKKSAAKRTNSANASLKMYRRIAVSFVILVAICLAVVVYVSTVRATIFIHPIEEEVRTQFILDVVNTPARESEIRGRVLAGTLGKSGTFTPSGTGEVEVPGIATGTVTLVNTSGTAQPLVATTRLLTADNILFRLNDNVTVPANGSVEAAASADVEGASGDIASGKLTIPGLNTTRQQEVYAEVNKPFTGGLSTIRALSQEDIDVAVAELLGQLEEDAKIMLRTEAGELFAGESFTTTILEQTASEAPGAEVDSFDLELTVRTVGVFYDQKALEEIAVRQLFNQIGQGREILDANTETIHVTVEKADVEEEMANVRVVLGGTSIASTTSGALEPSRFGGMTEEEVAKTIIGDRIAEDVEVEFFPFWVKKVPKLADHIYIEIL